MRHGAKLPWRNGFNVDSRSLMTSPFVATRAVAGAARELRDDGVAHERERHGLWLEDAANRERGDAVYRGPERRGGVLDGRAEPARRVDRGDALPQAVIG